MFHSRIMVRLLVITLLLAVSHQYTIAVRGRLDIGDRISGFLKEMYNRLLSNQGSADQSNLGNTPQGSAGNAMRHMSKKSPMLHVYGSHVGKREGEKPVNNINVK